MGSPLPHLHRDWAHHCHICTGTWAHPSHICTGTRLRYYNDENFVREDASSREPDGGSRLDSFLTAVNAAVIAMIIGIYIMTCGAP